MYRKVLVTGASGVLGNGVRAVASEYPEYKFVFLTSSDCDLRDQMATQALFQEHEPYGVLHLAAVSGGIGLSMRHPASLLRDNTLITLSIMEAARICEVQKLVMTLTTGMYPENAPLPLNEDNMHDGWPHPSNYGSSFAKRLIDPAIRAYREEYNLAVVGLIPSGIFGPHDNFNFEDAPMLPALIRRFYENRDGKTPLIVWGDGTPLREYTFSQDLARIFIWALKNYDAPQCLNVGTVEEHSIREIALMVADCLHIDPTRIVFDTTKPQGIYRKNVDNSRFLALEGFQYTPFIEGLRRTVEWFAAAYERYPEVLRLYSKNYQERIK